MILTPSTAPLVATDLAELANALDTAAAKVRALVADCDGSLDGFERVAARAASLVAELGAATAEASHAAVLAEQCTWNDRACTAPDVEPAPGDELARRRVEHQLETTPGWNEDVPMPADLDPIIARVEANALWLAERSLPVRDHLCALATLKQIRAAVRLVEAVVSPAVELAPERFDGSATRAVSTALGLARTRLMFRRSAAEGSS